MKGLCIMCNKWDASCDCNNRVKSRTPKFSSAVVLQNQFIQLTSDDWRVFDNGKWRRMTVTEQEEAS